MLIGVSEPTADEWARKGLPVAIVDPRLLKEGTGLSSSSSGLGLFNRAPHPNAAKVYINWLLSKEGQTEFAVASGYISSRLDVPTDHAAWRTPIPGGIKNLYPRSHHDDQGKGSRSAEGGLRKIVGEKSSG